jgi:predicted transposase YdaD
MAKERQKQAIALNMIRKHLDLETIAEVTGLTIAQLQQLQSQAEQNYAITINLLRSGLAIESIAQDTGLTIEQLQQLQAENQWRSLILLQLCPIDGTIALIIYRQSN